MIGVGVVGVGYWGPNLVRNFMETPGASVTAICDTSPQALGRVAARCPAAKTYGDVKSLLADPAVDAVVVTTPVRSHFEVAAAAIEAGKHVLVTKPLTQTVAEAERLVELAAAKQRVLMVDHTFVYTGAVRKAKELVAAGELGELLYYDSVRVNLGLFQSDVNVVWDLAPHDLSILECLVSDPPVAVSAYGIRQVPGQPENIGYVTLFYSGKRIAHLHVNWLAPVKVRQTLIGGSKKMIVYDDMEPSEKIKVYDRGVELTEVERAPDQINALRISYRSGDMFAPRLDGTEALRLEARHFVECIEQGHKPITDGEAGLRVVRVLEAANESMATGRVVELSARKK